MNARVTFTPCPPEYHLSLSLEQFAAQDGRFRALARLRERGGLGLAVQDSADLQDAHVRLRVGSADWTGTPGALDEEEAPGLRARPFAGWSEAALEYALALDAAPVARRDLPLTAFADLAAERGTGLVYILAPRASDGTPVVTRRLNLARFVDRLELEFLLLAPPEGLALRLHALGADGTHEVWRAADLSDGMPVPVAVETASAAARE